MKKLLSVFAALFFLAGPVFAQGAAENVSRAAGRYIAAQYAFNPLGVIGPNAPTGTGVVSYTMTRGDYVLPDGRDIVAFFAGQSITFADANIETVNITSVSGCAVNAPNLTCVITLTVANVHGQGGRIFSGTAGLQEAIQDAATNSGVGSQVNAGGVVLVDSQWVALGGTTAMLTAAVVQPRVVIEDERNYAPQYWTPVGAVGVLATPATLTAVTALPSAAPVGAFGTGTYHMCIAYVDVMGQEGTCSADFSEAGLATGSFIFSAPAASTGAVGYTIYIGLTGGGVTNLDYKVPLVTQPTVTSVLPVSNGVCVLTQVETVTPACAIVNSTYGQATGSTATVTAITLSTSPINPQTTVVSTTSIYVPNPGGRAAYVYAPGLHIGLPGMLSSSLAWPITTAEVTVVPDVAGTINLPPGFMNFVGRTLRVCGNITTTASVATIVDVQFQWDAMGQNTAGKGVLIGDLTATPVTALVTGKATFCQDFQTTVAAATATGGSINHIGSSGAVGGITLVAPGAFSDAMTAGAVGSLNLAEDARLNIIILHTTATDGAGWILQGLTLTILN